MNHDTSSQLSTSGSLPYDTRSALEPLTESGNHLAAQPRTVSALSWFCTDCKKECLPIRSESRCLCGHRLKEHLQQQQHGGKGSHKDLPTCRCTRSQCACQQFFFIVAEGSWVLKCRCKHKHTQHDPLTRACDTAGCSCQHFDSPWVCNCNHAWAAHKQVMVQRTAGSFEGMLAELQRGEAAAASHKGAVLLPGSTAGIADDINRWDCIQRGQHEVWNK